MDATLSQLLHTLRYLKPIQIGNRIQRRLFRPSFKTVPAPPQRSSNGTWHPIPRRTQSLITSESIQVFQQRCDVRTAQDWNAQLSHLVLYNLHYFDDLIAKSARQRTDWHRALMHRWVNENPPGSGVGWEPYPLSLRIVNWIKWQLDGHQLDSTCLDSLATQVTALSQQLEFHLLGNHLLANAKALVFAGCFFAGPKADEWLNKGLTIFRQQLPEQVLSDGGHFELSPMYHSIILEDLLDLFNLSCCFHELDLTRKLPQLVDTIHKMRDWLAVMQHPDGRIAFFNDAAFDIAISPNELENYASRLQLPSIAKPSEGITHLSSSGYIRLQREASVLLLDVAEVGPTYQPGHAHADTLSFEWSWGDNRVVVNSGTSCYGVSAERLRQRSTSAHSTIEIDGHDSSEVWSGFRVARRAHPTGLRLNDAADELWVQCAHNGYQRLPGHVVHQRQWCLRDTSLHIEDRLTGRFQRAVARFFLHPSVEIQSDGRLLCGPTPLRYDNAGGTLCCEPATYHPQFDVNVDNFCLNSQIDGSVHKLLWQW